MWDEDNDRFEDEPPPYGLAFLCAAVLLALVIIVAVIVGRLIWSAL